MITLALAMIVKNEEKTLERCLKSVSSIFDEIIIVDTGSTDKTKQIAKKYTDKIFDFQWIFDFSAARNFAFSKSTMQYTMWLDADDEIDEKNVRLLIDLKQTLDENIDCVFMRYLTGFDEFGNVTFSYYRERIVKTEKNFKWVDSVHEFLEVSGEKTQVEIGIMHKPEKKVSTKSSDDTKQKSRNLLIYEKMVEQKKDFSPRNTLYYGRELFDNQFFFEASQQFQSFLESGKGWVEDNITSCVSLSRCYQHLGVSHLVLPTLFRSFSYALPRAEVVFEIGNFYWRQKDFEKSIFYYEFILTLKKPKTWGFIQDELWDFSPLLQLCVLYDQLGKTDKALFYHSKAKQLKPNNPAVLFNEKYFATKL